MATLRETLDWVSFRVTSPDKTIRIHADLRGRLDVSLADGALGRHTAESLARQLEYTLRVGFAAQEHARNTVLPSQSASW